MQLPQNKDFILPQKPHSPLSLWRSLDKSQKIALSTLAVFVLFLVIVWIIQFKKSLTDPFIYKGVDNASSTDSTVASDEALKNKDTDGDGLSDWDELNIYKTSPYLEDTDGDGLLDGEEVKRGSDPNCPEGKICTAADTSVTTATGQSSSTLEQLLGRELDVSQASSSETDLQNLLQGGSDAAKLRKMLLDSGMDVNILNQISDKELMDTYNKTKK